MNRPLLAIAFFAIATAAVAAQQPAPAPSPDAYQGQSNPPADDTIVTSPPDQPKPPAGHPATDPSARPDDGTMQIVAPPISAAPTVQPALTKRSVVEDPDGDMVHPHPLGPGDLGEGASIRVRLLTRISTSDSQVGDTFRSRVASDVLQDGQVLIPAGAEIDGRVVEISSGHTGGHGTMRLRPETVILADGTRCHLDAQVTGTPGSNTRITGEGVINAGSRTKRDGAEVGGAVGVGAATGAVIGGPVGAVAGGLIGAGAITVHLLTNHPQATLDPGTTLLFTLTDRLHLVAANTLPAN